LTASDKGARGEREDLSAAAIGELVATIGAEVVAYDVVPDEREILSAKLIAYADVLQADLVLTTGGTGLGPRDVTPEATLAVIDRVIPGIAEAMRAAGLQQTPHSMLSRAVAGSRGRTLIVNLPGSPRAVRENLAVILPALPHALGILQGSAGECARPESAGECVCPESAGECAPTGAS
jgi:molybdenum cofactor synthesis domain-containing protein